ncbi:MAG: MerR family transcriptional regulator, partial [Polyangiaceae bacterium]
MLRLMDVQMPVAESNARYSIRLVSRMSGISAHTLRMWERRYGFPEPERTSGGARRYTEQDVERLKLVARALELGYRPNEVVGKGSDTLRKLVAEQEAVPAVGGDLPDVARAVDRVREDELDEVGVEIRRAVAVLGPKQFVTDFAAPFVQRVGELWSAGEVTIGQEHLSSELLTTELRVLLRAYDTLKGRPRVILTTLTDEHHVLGLTMVALYLAVSGAEARIVGTSTPLAEIADLAARTQADIVGLSLSSATASPRARAQVAELAEM